MKITAIDSNILIDIASADAAHGSHSRAALESCAREGSLIISPEVVAEFASGCASAAEALAIVKALTIEYVDIGEVSAAKAGEVRARKRRGGRMISDFMIAMHAAAHADRLLTRDADFSRMNVRGLVVVTPEDVFNENPEYR